jgi:hypothetical protein
VKDGALLHSRLVSRAMHADSHHCLLWESSVAANLPNNSVDGSLAPYIPLFEVNIQLLAIVTHSETWAQRAASQIVFLVAAFYHRLLKFIAPRRCSQVKAKHLGA